ncbi:MAG: hypothetical protein ACK559_14365 [bacterium]
MIASAGGTVRPARTGCRPGARVEGFRAAAAARAATARARGRPSQRFG